MPRPHQLRRVRPEFAEKIYARIGAEQSVLREEPPEEIMRAVKSGAEIRKRASLLKLWVLSGEMGRAAPERRKEIIEEMREVWPAVRGDRLRE
jgi:hypothetical protein